MPQKSFPKNKEEKNKNNEINNFFKENFSSLWGKIFPVPLKEKLFFTQHLGIMLKAGLSISLALTTLAKQTSHKRFARILSAVAADVEKGKSLADSFRPHEKIFGELFINMVQSGEVSGQLEEILGQIHLQLKKQHNLTSKVKNALIYPVVILIAMGGIGVFMMIFVIPKLTQMIKEFGASLPLLTKILIAISDGIVEHGLVVLIILILSIFLAAKLLSWEKGRYYWQAFLLKFPVISPIFKKINLARFARTVSSLLSADIPIVKTFQITAQTLSNLHYRLALLETGEQIQKGGSIGGTFARYPRLFPPVTVQIIEVGEKTGELDNVLKELADFYENEVEQTMNSLPSLIEPLLILILGGAVGLMAVAIILPMYSMTAAL